MRRIPALLFALCACASKAPPSHVSATGTNQAAVASASVAPVASSSAPAGPLEDLLWVTSARVAVSSRVRNPRDLPDHLVDHKPETAWNGRTDDLAGGWLSFLVPKDAHVAHILLTVGFDKVAKNGEDLFTANYRIKRVRILHEDKPVREVDLDPNVRAPQRIDIDGGGGAYRIEVLAVEPGAHAGWRELVVSELAVMGTPGSHRLSARAPIVRIGSLDEDDPAPLASAPDLARACAAFVGDDAVALEQAKSEGMIASDVEIERATCTSSASLAKSADVEASAANVKLARPGGYNVTFEGKLLVLRDSRGAHLMNIRIEGKEMAMFWSLSYELVDRKWITTPSGPVFAVQVAEGRTTDSDGYFPPGHESEAHSEETRLVAFACKVGTSAPVCTTSHAIISSQTASAKATPAPTRVDHGAVVFGLSALAAVPGRAMHCDCMIAYVTTNTTYFVEDRCCVRARSHAGKRTHVPSGATLIWPPKLGDPLVFFFGDRRVITTEVLAVQQ